jgi:NAD(P)-dependent dehydrogenase (short-subunit alcohol dehydrogenase family)
MMAKRLSERVCLITGTGGGMGKAAALLFARQGAMVIGTDINTEKSMATEKEVLEAGGTMQSLSPCDLTVQSDCERLVSFAIEKHGRIDVLYNNAAMAYFGWIDAITNDQWYKTIDQELNLVFLMTRAAWPGLKRSRAASIINVGSVSGVISLAPLPAVAHSAAKGGVIAMTRQLALEGRKFNIRANTISPGIIETEQTKALLTDQTWSDAMVGKVMLERVGQPEDVVATALFLASDESSYITATNIPVDGGMTSW